MIQNYNMKGYVTNNFLKKVKYKKMSREEEYDYIKKSKLSFYYNKDTDDFLREQYLKYYMESFPDFKKEYEKSLDCNKDDLIRVAVSNSKMYRDKFLENNQLLVYKNALKFSKGTQSLSLMDLINEGNIGLMRALTKFDIDKGYKFSTYATIWIKQAIGIALTNKDKIIRAPLHFNDAIIKTRKVEDELFYDLHRRPSFEEIADAANLSLKVVRDAKQFDNYMWSIGSLDKPLDNETMETLADHLKSDEEDFTQEINNIVDYEVLDRLLVQANFSSQMMHIVLFRYGFIDGKYHGYKDISDRLKISYDTVVKTDKQVLKKLRNELLKMDFNCQRNINECIR